MILSVPAWHAGNAAVDGADGGWFIGHHIPPGLPGAAVCRRDDVVVSGLSPPRGERRLMSAPDPRTTLTMLACGGEFVIERPEASPDGEVVLARTGDCRLLRRVSPARGHVLRRAGDVLSTLFE